MLAQRIADGNVPPFSERLTKMLAKVSNISDVFDQVKQAIDALIDDRKIVGDLRDGVDHKLSPIFEHARGLRNRSGYPTGDEVGTDDAEAALLLFPGFYRYAVALMAKVAALSLDNGGAGPCPLTRSPSTTAT